MKPLSRVVFRGVCSTALFLICMCSAQLFAQNVISLDPTKTYQTMTGWEVVDFSQEWLPCGAQCTDSNLNGFGYINPAQPQYEDTLAFQLVNKVGYNRVRLEVWCGFENPVDRWTQYATQQITTSTYSSTYRYQVINDNADPNVINNGGFQWSFLDMKIDRDILPLKKYIEANGEHLYINLQYVCFQPSVTAHETPSEYAEMVLATYQHMQSKYGFVPDLWSVILEPDANTHWASTQGTTEGQAVKAAGDKLVANGFTPHFVVANTECIANAITYFDNIRAVPGAMAYISEIGYHR